MAKTYRPTKLKPLLQIIVSTVLKNPEMAQDMNWLHRELSHQIEGFDDEKTCINCSANMAAYVYEVDVQNCLLVKEMAEVVETRMHQENLGFTAANKIKVNKDRAISHSSKTRTGQAHMLGLIAKAGDAQWSVTTRGYALLRNEPVPAWVVVFREEIIERTEQTVRISDVFSNHNEKMRQLELAHKALRHDKRSSFADYDPNKWVHFGGYQQGKLF